MKKNKKKLVIAIVLLLLMLAIFLIGGYTYSKYITQVRGKGVIDIARWNFKVNNQSSTMGTINLADTFTPETIKDNKLAPGVKGDFDIVIDATECETGVEYAINFENIKDKPKNLEYGYGDIYVSDIKELEPYLTGIIHANDEERTRTIKLYWSWRYESANPNETIEESNEQDTIDGRTLSQHSFDIVVTGTQELPERIEN